MYEWGEFSLVLNGKNIVEMKLEYRYKLSTYENFEYIT